MATKISWCDEVWNPTTGCSRVSEGCRHCYAEALSLRFGWSTKPWTAANAPENLVLYSDRLDKPLRWRSPRRVFVNSMSDLFHEEIPEEFIRRVFAVMKATRQHTYQVLTKRANRMRDMLSRWYQLRSDGYGVEPLANVQLGVSVEDQKNAAERVPELLATPAAVRFVSCEPLLAPVCLVPAMMNPPWDPFAPRLNWVIVGGESGPHMNRHPERWMKHEWARAIRDQCVDAGVAFWFKQSSGLRTEMGTALEHEDGSLFEWRQFPGELTPPTLIGQTPYPGAFDGPPHRR